MLFELILFGVLGQVIRSMYGLSKFISGSKRYKDLQNSRFFLPLITSGAISGSSVYMVILYYQDILLISAIGLYGSHVLAGVLGYVVGEIIDVIGNKVEGK